MEQDPLFFVKKNKYFSWIIGLGFFVYANSLFNGFVWDDKTYIINNPQVHSLSWNLVFGQNWFNSAGFYRPIPAVYFALLYAVSGNVSFFYHVFQVALHIINALLVFSLFKKFFNKNLSLILSLIFLVHPMNTESVGYIASSVSVLFFFFGLTALLLSWQDNVSVKKQILIFFLLLLSVMTKETGVLFIFLVVLSRFLFKKGEYVRYIVGSVITGIIYLALRVVVIGIAYLHQNTVPIMQLTLSQRIFHMPAILLYYLKTFFFPLNLAVSQNWTLAMITFVNFYLPLILEMVLCCFVLLAALQLKGKIQAALIFFFVWAACGLGMLLQIIPLDMTVADRWFYFPIIGLLGILGVLYETYVHIKNKRVILAIPVILIGLLSFRTMLRNADWIDAQTLYGHDIAVSDDYNKEDGLAAELIAQGKFDEAFPHVKQSVHLFANFANVNDLGVLYQHKGDIQHATVYYQKAIAMHPGTISPYLNLASVYALHDDPQKAVPILKSTLIKQYPNISRFWLLLAVAEYRMGETNNALSDARMAYQLSANAQTLYLRSVIEGNTPIKNIDLSKFE